MIEPKPLYSTTDQLLPYRYMNKSAISPICIVVIAVCAVISATGKTLLIDIFGNINNGINEFESRHRLA